MIVNQSIIDKFHAQSFLEIGLAEAYNFYCIDVHHKIAVDPKVKNNWCINTLKTYKKNTKLVELTSDEFFASNIEYFDLIFIDGLHQSQQVIKDVQNALKFLNSNGIIVLHDFNPTSKVSSLHSMDEWRKCSAQEISDGWNGDVWKAIAYFRSERDDLEIFVLDCDYGLGIIKKVKNTVKKIGLPCNYKLLEYDFLDENRAFVLNLKPYLFFEEWIKDQNKDRS